MGVMGFQEPAVCLGKKASRAFPNRRGEMKFFTVTYVRTYDPDDGKSYTARLPLLFFHREAV